MENMKLKIQNTAEDIKDRLEDITDNLRSTLKGKMQDVRDIFQSFVSYFSGSQ